MKKKEWIIREIEKEYSETQTEEIYYEFKPDAALIREPQAAYQTGKRPEKGI